MSDGPYPGIQTIVTVSSEWSGISCIHCGFNEGYRHEVTMLANHYIQEHGYQLLHVGQETARADEWVVFHHTVAVLGNDEILPELEPPEAKIITPDDMLPGPEPDLEPEP